MDFDKIIKESINSFLLESKIICEQVDINQQIQMLMKQMQSTQDPNQKSILMQQIQTLQMQQQQQSQGDSNKGTPLSSVGITPGAAGEAIGGEVLARGATHAVDYAGNILSPTKNKVVGGVKKVWKGLKPGTRSGLKWGAAAAGVAAGGYAVIKMKKKMCKNKCYERFTDQKQINDCLRLC